MHLAQNVLNSMLFLNSCCDKDKYLNLWSLVLMTLTVSLFRSAMCGTKRISFEKKSGLGGVCVCACVLLNKQ